MMGQQYPNSRTLSFALFHRLTQYDDRYECSHNTTGKKAVTFYDAIEAMIFKEKLDWWKVFSMWNSVTDTIYGTITQSESNSFVEDCFSSLTLRGKLEHQNYVI